MGDSFVNSHMVLAARRTTTVERLLVRRTQSAREAYTSDVTQAARSAVPHATRTCTHIHTRIVTGNIFGIDTMVAYSCKHLATFI